MISPTRGRSLDFRKRPKGKDVDTVTEWRG